MADQLVTREDTASPGITAFEGSPSKTGTGLVPAMAAPGTRLVDTSQVRLPAIIADAGEDAVTRFAEYFTAHIRNPHTRRAYFRNAIAFLRWCEGRGVRELKAIKPMLVAAYIEQLQRTRSRPTVKQQLATIRMLFDWLVTGQVMATNPAHSVRGPRHVVSKGKTPVLTPEETKAILECIRSSGRSALTPTEAKSMRPMSSACGIGR
jgi:integrase